MPTANAIAESENVFIFKGAIDTHKTVLLTVDFEREERREKREIKEV